MRLAVALIALALAAIPMGASAQVDEDAVRNAQLTLSAFKCFGFAKDEADQERLFNLGYEAGKAFIERMSKNPPNKATADQIAILWMGTRGPTADFILGQIFSEMLESAYDE